MFNKYLASSAVAAILLGAAGAASAQMINTDGATFSGSTVTFQNIDAASDGYLVVHAVENGAVVVPSSLGHTPVAAGMNSVVTVDIGMPFEEGMTYEAMLHDETNGNDTYDFAAGMTDVDVPSMSNGAPVVRSFVVAKGGMDAAEPSSEYATTENTASEPNDAKDSVQSSETATRVGQVPMFADAPVAVSGNTVTFPRVDAGQNGYVAVHAVENGAPVTGADLGHTAIMAGENTNVSVTTEQPLVSGQQYVAMIYTETNDNDFFDLNANSPEIDFVARVDGNPVMIMFTAS